MNNVYSRLTPVQSRLIRAAGELAMGLSLARSVGQIYALLYISPEPLSFNELCQKLRISKGTASVNLRVLEAWDALEKVWVKGRRQVHYRALRDLRRIILRRLEEGGRRRLEMARSRLSELEAALKGSVGNGKQIPPERMQELKSFLRTVERGLKLLPRLNSLFDHPLLGSLLRGNGK